MTDSNPLLQEVFERFIGPVIATQCEPLLFESELSEERVTALTKIFESHSHLISPFEALVQGLNPGEAGSPLEEKIRFLATRHVRTWLLVSLLNETLKCPELSLDEKTGRFLKKPSELLPYATRAQNAFGDESRYKDFAFAGGFFFDFLFYAQRSQTLTQANILIDEQIENAFVLSLGQIKRLMVLCRYKQKLSLEKLAPLTIFFRNLAPLILSWLRPHQAIEFYQAVEDEGVPEVIRLLLEKQKFGITSSVVSSFLADSLHAFHPLAEVMSVWGFPYLSWVPGRKDIHDLSALALLAVTKARSPEMQFLQFDLSEEIKREAQF